jgi:hypothetical protein
MISRLKLAFKSNYWLFKIIRFIPGRLGYFGRRIKSDPDEFWKQRIETVLAAPDNAAIDRVHNAGRITHDVQRMHNGILIHVGSYYGDGNTLLLYHNQGVHEPQEEKVFGEILEYLPSSSIMLELGSFWGFYSMTFLKRLGNGKSFLIEPDPHALLSGVNNFKLNKMKGEFFNYFVSDEVQPGHVPTITIDRFLEHNGINYLDILHSDIQGFELRMLKGAKSYLSRGAIGYVFISTHSNELHEACKAHLLSLRYTILCDANLEETYSWDGLIVAKHVDAAGPNKLKIHKKE